MRSQGGQSGWHIDGCVQTARLDPSPDFGHVAAGKRQMPWFMERTLDHLFAKFHKLRCSRKAKPDASSGKQCDCRRSQPQPSPRPRPFHDVPCANIGLQGGRHRQLSELLANHSVKALLDLKPSAQFRITADLLKRLGEKGVLRVLSAGTVGLQQEFGLLVIHNVFRLVPRPCPLSKGTMLLRL